MWSQNKTTNREAWPEFHAKYHEVETDTDEPSLLCEAQQKRLHRRPPKRFKGNYATPTGKSRTTTRPG
eukprot:359413-Lingulodinium_polyedra.AAC.1